MKQKRIVTLLVAAMMVSGSMVGCGNADTADIETTETSANTVQTTDTESVVEETEETIPPDALPELNYEGEEFSAMTRYRDFFHSELFLEESTGEILNDARFEAKLSVENRLNVTLKETYYDDQDAPRRLLQSGDSTHDLITGRHLIMFNYAAEGMIQKVTDIPHINLDAAWWDKSFSEQLIVGDTQYFAIGANNLTGYDSIHILLFNKEMAADYHIDNFYDMVREGTWTWDAMNEAMGLVVMDTNGDGNMDDADQYGLLSLSKQVLPSFLIAGKHYMINKDEDNYIINNMEGNEAFYNAYIKIFDMCYTNDHWYYGTWADVVEQDLINMFTEGQGLFTNTTGGRVADYRNMDINFGMLPYPKETVEQETYYSRSEYPELQGIPLTNMDLEMTGAILEALASEYLRTVEPVYFDVTLNGKIARDVESVDMLDIIYANRIFDFGDTIFCTEIRDGYIRQNFEDNNRDLVSTLVSNHNVVQNRLDMINEGFGKEQ